MGIRLHYHVKHVVENAGEAFSYAHEEIYNLLSEHDCSVYADNTEYPEGADEFCVPFEDVEHLIDDLDEMDREAVLFKTGEGMFEREYKVGEVLDFFRDAYENADKDNSDIYFSWF